MCSQLSGDVWASNESEFRCYRNPDHNSPQKHVWRVRISLLSTDGLGTSDVTRVTGTSKACVYRWQQCFMEVGTGELLIAKTRPSRIPSIAEAVIGRVMALTLTEPPGEITH